MPEDPAAEVVVLVVEDERDLADLYTKWLESEYTPRTAYTGESALEQMDDQVDVVLLDRRLPGISGDEFLDEVRDAGYDCPVAMVSAVEPDVDIVEMGFDDYVVKPVEKQNLIDLVGDLAGLGAAPETVRDYLSLVAKRDVLESKLDAGELAESEQYASLTSAISVFEQHLVSVARSYLDDEHESLLAKDRRLIDAERRELREQLQKLDPNDPLRDAVATELDKLDALLDRSTEDIDAKRGLLRATAEGFVAKGFWLDPAILRALNHIFRDTDGETLVLERRTIGPNTQLEGQKLITASRAVRERARSELDSIRSP